MGGVHTGSSEEFHVSDRQSSARCHLATGSESSAHDGVGGLLSR